jgi:hypothetical protein
MQDHERHIARTAAPHEVYPEALAQQRLLLSTYLEHHVRLALRFLSASDGELYLTDMLVTAAAQRSYHIVEGFLTTWDSWNVVAAAPLLRMQIDTLLRMSYAARSANSDHVVHALLEQNNFRRLRDPKGRRLHDNVLVEYASEHYPWLPKVYERSNEWVHFSTRHIFNTFHVEDDSEDETSAGRVSGRIPRPPGDIPVELLGELIAVMNEATASIFGLFEAWESRKGRPSGEAGPPLGSDGA